MCLKTRMTLLTHSPTSPTVFKLNYFFIFAGIGVILPRIAIYLIEERAVENAGLILALTQFSAPLGALISGMFSDATMRVRSIALPCGFLLALISFFLGAFDPVGPHLLLLGFTVFSFLTGVIIPLTSVAYLQSGNEAELFGKVRLYGSLGFCMVNLFLVFYPVSFKTLFFIAGILFLIGCLPQFLLPKYRIIEGKSSPLSFKSQLLLTFSSSRYLLFISFVFLFFYVFSVQKFLVSARISRDLFNPELDYVSLFWSIGTFLEALFLYFSPYLLKIISATGLFFGAFLLTVIRYFFSVVFWDEPVFFVATQVMHGLQFGALHLGSILMLEKNLPGKVLGTAQAGVSLVGRSLGGSIGVYYFTTLLDGEGYFSIFDHALNLCSIITILTLIFYLIERKKLPGWVKT